MVGKTMRHLARISFRRPLPPPPRADNQPIPHAPKKTSIAITGTKPDRLCAICLGRLEAGSIMTICECGKFFHVSCINEVNQCPICNHIFAFCEQSNDGQKDAETQDETIMGGDTVETVYQCPVCYAYVREDADACQCGAVFDSEEEVYLCPGCGCEVPKDAKLCHNCNMPFE